MMKKYVFIPCVVMEALRHEHSAFNMQFWCVKKCALLRSTTCSDPIEFVDCGGVTFVSLRIWHMWGSTIFKLGRSINVVLLSICYHWDPSGVSQLSFTMSSDKFVWMKTKDRSNFYHTTFLYTFYIRLYMNLYLRIWYNLWWLYIIWNLWKICFILSEWPFIFIHTDMCERAGNEILWCVMLVMWL